MTTFVGGIIIFLLAGCWVGLFIITSHLRSIKRLLAKEVNVLTNLTQEKVSGEKTAAADLTTRMAELQRERFSPRIVR